MEYEEYPKNDGTTGYRLKLLPTQVPIGTVITLKCLVGKPSQRKVEPNKEKGQDFETFTAYSIFMKDEEQDKAIGVNIPKGTYFKLLKYGPVLKFKNITFTTQENKVTYTEDGKEITKLVKQFEVEVREDNGTVVEEKSAGDNINDALKAKPKQDTKMKEVDLSAKTDITDEEKSIVEELLTNKLYTPWIEYSNKGQKEFEMSYNGVASKMNLKDVSEDRFQSVYDYFLTR